MRRLIPFVSLILILCSCEEESSDFAINLNQFDQITENYPYQDLQPHKAVDYLELIFSIKTQKEEILFSTGQKCLNASNQNTCINTFDSLKNEMGGFGEVCLPLSCFQYLKYQRGDVIEMITNKNELIAFLGPIDSKSDALLLATSANYTFSTEEKEIGAIREISTGYELLVSKIVSYCAPIQTNRFLLEITTEGEINIIFEEVYHSSNACI